MARYPVYILKANPRSAAWTSELQAPQILECEVVTIHCGLPALLPEVPTPEEILQQGLAIDLRWEFWPE